MASFQPTALTPASAAWPYLAAFQDGASTFFVEYLRIGADKQLEGTLYTRKAFMKLALKGAGVLVENGLEPGASCVHYFTDNRFEDLVYRLSAVLAGTVPVTVNWQADTVERSLYKVSATSSLVVLVDDGVPKEFLDGVGEKAAVVDAAKALAGDDFLPLSPESICGETREPDTRIVIFTSGTTGNPKGVKLSFGSYVCNRATFEQFLDCEDPATALGGVVTNPFHHTNSTAITDWLTRRPAATLRLLQRYTTAYWNVIGAACTGSSYGDFAALSKPDVDALVAKPRPAQRVVCPLVSRHIDFLEKLCVEGKLPLGRDAFKRCASTLGATLLLGSAPVGPTTVARLRDCAGCLPTVRFGSTETCLQVAGTPLAAAPATRLKAFEAGWAHEWQGNGQCGYYIGRAHAPFTEVAVVKSTDKASADYLKPCAVGEPGQLVTRGRNLMSGYVGNDVATAKALDAANGGWYTNLGDVGFCLTNAVDGGADLYWLSRDSAMLIRGGANYAYEQINAELTAWAAATWFDGDLAAFEVAVVGLRVDSEHEDSCCATLQLNTDAAKAKRGAVEAEFLAKAKAGVSKGAKPDKFRVGDLPKNFKGVVLVKDLAADFKAHLGI